MDLTQALWRKSSYSTGNGGNCVEVATMRDGIYVRDSKHPDGPALGFTAHQWETFTQALTSGEFNG